MVPSWRCCLAGVGSGRGMEPSGGTTLLEEVRHRVWTKGFIALPQFLLAFPTFHVWLRHISQFAVPAACPTHLHRLSV